MVALRPSKSPTRATALAAPLSNFAGWRLAVSCPTCQALRYVLVDNLIARRGGASLLGDAVSWFHCRACGSPPHYVNLECDTEPMQQVLLIEKIVAVSE